MPKTVIEQFKTKIEVANANSTYFRDNFYDYESLAVSEMFGDTLQGEGIWAGHSATFLRLQGCTLDCVWCDTAEVWRKGNRYTFADLCALLRISGLVEKLKEGQHLVLTGGSPLKQQAQLIGFIQYFINIFGFKPYIEVENETVLMPDPVFAEYVDCWNNSPKLSNSGMKERARYKPEVIKATAQLPNSWFKFVVRDYLDWAEIQIHFIDTGLITKDQVILMPCGQTQEELALSRPLVADIASDKGVLFSDRLHVTIWNHKTGV